MQIKQNDPGQAYKFVTIQLNNHIIGNIHRRTRDSILELIYDVGLLVHVDKQPFCKSWVIINFICFYVRWKIGS